jgi:hypothetical protein
MEPIITHEINRKRDLLLSSKALKVSISSRGLSQMRIGIHGSNNGNHKDQRSSLMAIRGN